MESKNSFANSRKNDKWSLMGTPPMHEPNGIADGTLLVFPAAMISGVLTVSSW